MLPKFDLKNLLSVSNPRRSPYALLALRMTERMPARRAPAAEKGNERKHEIIKRNTQIDRDKGKRNEVRINGVCLIASNGKCFRGALPSNIR